MPASGSGSHLSKSVGERCWGNMAHAMDPRISRPRGFWFVFNRTRRSEDVFKPLLEKSVWGKKDNAYSPALTSSSFLKRPFHGFSGSYCSFLYTNIGQWEPVTVSSLFLSCFRTLWRRLDQRRWTTAMKSSTQGYSNPARADIKGSQFAGGETLDFA